MTKLCLGAVLFMVLVASTRAQEPSPARPPAFEVAKDGTVTVRGSVRFTDQKHDARDKVRGSVRAMVWYENDDVQAGPGTEVEIMNGQWTATLPRPERAGTRPERVSFCEARVDDNPVILETDELTLADGTDFVLRMRAIPELRVRVVDAETKKELTAVEVSRGKWSESWDAGTLHPISHIELLRIVESGRSPVVVPAPDEVRPGATTTLWIRAPGYAWFPLQVVFAEGGLREALLVRGGSVKFTIGGKLPAAGNVALRIYGAQGGGGRPLLNLSLAHGAPRPLEGLAPGRYEARVEHGEWFRQPRVLARAPLEIQAGSEAAVELVLAKDVEAPERVTLSGVFVLPQGWERAEKKLSVQLYPLPGTDRWTESRWLHERDLERGEKEGEYRFTFRDTVVGRYTLTIEPSQHQKVVRVPKDGVPDLRIEVPEPVEVVVRVVDRDTKQPRNGVRLMWNPERPLGVAGGSFETATAAADSNVVRFIAPAGRIQVFSIENDFEVSETLRVAPDDREFDVFATVCHGVKVALYEGTTRIPIDFRTDWDVSLLTLEEAVVPASQSSGSGELALSTKKAGTYLLRVTGPDGYRPVKDRQVKLGPPPFPTIEIRVERK